MKIEVATDSDIEQLNKLINDCWGAESHKGWTTEANLTESIRSTPASLREQMSKPTHTYFKCCEDNSDEILACVLGIHKEDNIMEVEALSVKPNMQSRGLGRKLFDVVEEHARKQKCLGSRLTAISSRTELLAWYERLGYKKNGKFGGFDYPVKFLNPEVPVVVIEMEKIFL